MLARLQQLLVSCVVGAAAVWGSALVGLGHPWWALTGALTILASHALLLGVECALSWYAQRGGPASRPNPATVFSAWAAEVVEVVRVFYWRQPFRSTRESDHLPAAARGRRGVVFVHGFVCNRALWNPWLRVLRATGTPCIAVNLEPVFGSIDAYPPLIETAVRRLETLTGLPVVLVGHSMGGLAIRAWLARYDADKRVGRVITIGSPHQGTALARWGRTANARQMQIGGPWLARLAVHEPANRYAMFTCFFGHCDNIVFPCGCATLPGAHNVHLAATAHVHMAFHEAAFVEVRRWAEVTRPSADASALGDGA